MKTSTILAPLVVLAVQTVATPLALVKRDDPSATEILQYALTLEHLEATFYSEALAKFDQQAFVNAGFEEFVHGRIAQIGQHEAAHVAFLTSALGKDAVAACTYNFPYTDPKSFVALSMVLEGVGTSAYLGAAQFLKDPATLTAAGAILTTEARHAAWIASAALKGTPWSGALDVPLSQNDVFSLASAFITSCPSSNPALPFKAFPSLTVQGTPEPGQTVQLSYDDSSSGDKFLALFTGLSTVFASIDGNKKVTIPDGLQGVVYAVVSNDGKTVTDASTIAGPAIMDFTFTSYATNP